MLVKFKEMSVYGKILIYPNNELAVKFANLLGKKTFHYSDIFNISELGFKTEIDKINAFNY